MCVGVPLQCGYGGVVSLCNLKHYYNKISGIKLVSLYSTIKMMHGPINIRNYEQFNFLLRATRNKRFMKVGTRKGWYRYNIFRLYLKQATTYIS